MTSSNASPPNVKQNRNDQCRCGDTETYTHTHTCRISWPWGVAKGARLCSEIVKFPWSKGHSTSIANTHTHTHAENASNCGGKRWNGEKLQNDKIKLLSCMGLRAALRSFVITCSLHGTAQLRNTTSKHFMVALVNKLVIFLDVFNAFSMGHSLYIPHFLPRSMSYPVRSPCLFARYTFYVCVCVCIYILYRYVWDITLS